MRYLLLCLLVSFTVIGIAHAQSVATFTYQRGKISIQRAAPPPSPALPWQDEKSPQAEANPLLDITVDIRPSASLYRQDGWISTGGLAEGSGWLFIFDKPQQAHMAAMEIYQPLDVLWVNADGVITSIAPNLMPAGKNEPLIDPKPSKAILLLAGGSTERNNIAPGDKITGSEFFEPPPRILKVQ